MVAAGDFREDLYYRLNVVSLHLPPLRDRREDIPLLVERFLERFRAEYSRPALALSPQALDALVRYDWPGNVRQLQNTIERMVLLAEGDEIAPDSLPDDVRSGSRDTSSEVALPAGATFHEAVEAYERALIRGALAESDGVQRRAAERLGMKPTTLSERMKRLGIR